MKLFSTLLLTLAAIGAAATSSTPKVVRTVNKGVESSRQLSEQGTGNNSNPTPNNSRPNSYPTPYYPTYSPPSGGSKPSPSKPHKKKPPAKKTKKPKSHPKPKATPHKPSSSSHSSSSSGYSVYKPYGYNAGSNTGSSTYYSAVGALGLVGVAAAVLAKKVSST